ncbi:MAG TPA: hypothetical protein G4O00_14405 [Thermoflexia bacterium]|nr:hypothetical protein [Thermoflexia bacterium]
MKFTLRLHPGQDDDLIRWLGSLDGLHFGAKTQAVKEALRRGIESGDGPGRPAPAPAVDLPEIRAVVEAAVEQALARFEGRVSATPSAPPEVDEEVEALLDGLGANLVLADEG